MFAFQNFSLDFKNLYGIWLKKLANDFQFAIFFSLTFFELAIFISISYLKKNLN
jgi:hypothetical protein